MEFHNLTPFQSLAYNTINTHDEELHTVALKVAYTLAPGGAGGLTHHCEVAPKHAAGKLLVSDAFDGEMNRSSPRAESDVAAFKPRCDVVVRATAHAPGGRPAPRWPTHLRVSSREAVLIDKIVEVCGPRWFVRERDRWSLTESEPVASVPVRWERAFGGRSFVANPDSTESRPLDPLLHEVCASNPVGCGWVEARYVDTLRRIDAPIPERLAAPQLERPDARITSLVVAEHPNHGLNAKEMAEHAAGYGHTPAGFGLVGRAWAPRLAKAGTIDDAWVRDRHPFLPDDFSFAYWNAAPEDQQIAYPAQGLRVELLNLTAPEHSAEGYVAFELPPHRGFVMAWMGGLPVPVPAVIDTVTVDAEAMTVSCVWRVLISRALGVTKLEARFEVDPTAPLLKLQVGGSNG